MQRLLFLKKFGFRNVLFKYDVKIRQSFSLSAVKKEIGTETVLRENMDVYYNLSTNSNERILLNVDLVDIAPYEHYFVLTDNTSSKTISEEAPERFVPSDYIKTKTYDILDGIQKLKSVSYLPKKINDAIRIIDCKLKKLCPGYVINPMKAVDISIAYKFISETITQTNVDASYIDVSLQIGLFPRAFQYMKKVRLENNSLSCVTYKSVIVDSVFYEPAAYLLAKNGKITNILSFVTEMEEANILPGLPVVFSGLEAIGRKEVINKNIVEKMLSIIDKHEISLEKTFLAVPLLKENFPFIMRAINSFYPNFNLSVNNSSMKKLTCSLKNSPLNSTVESLKKAFDDQLEMEKQFHSSNEETSSEIRNELQKQLQDIERNWRLELTNGFKKRLNMLSISDRGRLYPYMMALPVDLYVNMMIDLLYRCMIDSSVEFSKIESLYSIIGEVIENHYRRNCLQREKNFVRLKSVYKTFLSKYQNMTNNVRLNDLWNESIIDNIQSGNIKLKAIPWDDKLKMNLGRLIYEIMFENLNVTFRRKSGVETRTPVLYEELVETHDSAYTAVRVQSKLVSIFKEAKKLSVRFLALELPMLHPPIPICDNYSSPYFHVSNYATRFVRAMNLKDIYDEDLVQPGDITDIYNALNVLSMCSWIIDTENLDIITTIFKGKGDLKLRIPLRGEEMDIKKASINMKDYTTYSQYKEVYDNFKKDKDEMHSLWVTLLYKINVAEIFRDKQFWFPYSMDFRGRVYPCPPHLSHIGNDTTRGLMKFSVGKKLGPNGLDWLKIHVINLCGTHKRSSNADRLIAANNSLSEIIDSAVNPLNGRKWWQKGDKPWQTLLACRELHMAIKFANEQGHGSADDFVSHIGIHQDGSCNGLQHYAALGRDIEGARAVNLIPMETPQDVYSDVLKIVCEIIADDVQKDVKEAILLTDKVTRKIIKQTVMTKVYGVTPFGASEQIKRQLKELDSIPKDQLGPCSNYLGNTVLVSIGELFHSASKIQNWFVELASAVARVRKTNISWMTPLNLIVTQPYYSDERSSCLTADMRKNKDAFPPNFIHSLDSTHMMMTALKCWEKNVTFVSVHDCYWTHACDVDEMNKICREAFVELYKKPILEDLSDYLYSKYGFHQTNLTKKEQSFNDLLRKVPEKGSYNIKDVLKSTYFFS